MERGEGNVCRAREKCVRSERSPCMIKRSAMHRVGGIAATKEEREMCIEKEKCTRDRKKCDVWRGRH